MTKDELITRIYHMASDDTLMDDLREVNEAIEALTAEVEHLRQIAEAKLIEVDTIKKLQAEVERLRGLLKEVQDKRADPHYDPYADVAFDKAMLRAALAAAVNKKENINV